MVWWRTTCDTLINRYKVLRIDPLGKCTGMPWSETLGTTSQLETGMPDWGLAQEAWLLRVRAMVCQNGLEPPSLRADRCEPGTNGILQLAKIDHSSASSKRCRILPRRPFEPASDTERQSVPRRQLRGQTTQSRGCRRRQTPQSFDTLPSKALFRSGGNAWKKRQ
jgi:hypothetical protein